MSITARERQVVNDLEIAVASIGSHWTATSIRAAEGRMGRVRKTGR